MITPDLVKEYFDEMANAAGCTLVRELAKGPRPPYPLMSYKILLNNVSPDYTQSQAYEAGTPDENGDRRKLTRTLLNTATVSVSFRALNNLNQAATAATTAFRWAISYAGRRVAEDGGFVVRYISSAPEDRTVALDGQDYEDRWGFDVRIDSILQSEEQIEVIEHVVIDFETPDGEEQIEVTT